MRIRPFPVILATAAVCGLSKYNKPEWKMESAPTVSLRQGNDIINIGYTPWVLNGTSGEDLPKQEQAKVTQCIQTCVQDYYDLHTAVDAHNGIATQLSEYMQSPRTSREITLWSNRNQYNPFRKLWEDEQIYVQPNSISVRSKSK